MDFFQLLENNTTLNFLVTNILQNIFFCVQQKKESSIQVWNKQRVFVPKHNFSHIKMQTEGTWYFVLHLLFKVALVVKICYLTLQNRSVIRWVFRQPYWIRQAYPTADQSDPAHVYHTKVHYAFMLTFHNDYCSWGFWANFCDIRVLGLCNKTHGMILSMLYWVQQGRASCISAFYN